MKIDVNFNINKDYVKGVTAGSKSQVVGDGWVTVDRFLKFPVSYRVYQDKETGKEKFFVSYPSQKTKNGYEDIAYPKDPELRTEIESKIRQAMYDKLTPVADVNIGSVRVSLLPPKPDQTVKTRGIASAEISGMIINRICVKEGKHGLFIEMPQYFAGEAYRDLVYATTSATQKAIESAILTEYSKIFVVEAMKIAGYELSSEQNGDVPNPTFISGTGQEKHFMFWYDPDARRPVIRDADEFSERMGIVWTPEQREKLGSLFGVDPDSLIKEAEPDTVLSDPEPEAANSVEESADMSVPESGTKEEKDIPIPAEPDALIQAVQDAVRANDTETVGYLLDHVTGFSLGSSDTYKNGITKRRDCQLKSGGRELIVQMFNEWHPDNMSPPFHQSLIVMVASDDRMDRMDLAEYDVYESYDAKMKYNDFMKMIDHMTQPEAPEPTVKPVAKAEPVPTPKL